MPSRKVRLISCVGVEHDLALLPHFVRYYLAMGVAPSCFHLVLNGPNGDSEAMRRARSILTAHGIEPEEVWIAPYTSDAMWEKRRTVQQRVADPADWVLSADVDEFHEFPAPLPDFLRYCERRSVNCVQGVFIDRLAPGGELAAVAPDPPIWEQFPVQADVMCPMRSTEPDGWWYGTVNVMASRGEVRLDRGGHHPLFEDKEIKFPLGRQLAKFPVIVDAPFRFAIPLRVHHFKWTDSLVTGLRRRLDTPGVSRRGKAYGQRLLDYLDRAGGIALDDVPIKETSLLDRLPWRARIGAFRAGSLALRVAEHARYRTSQIKNALQH